MRVYYREKGLGEFVFVTHFPTAKRPFYVMDDPHNPRETLSFDLLFRGLEVTTGGQRIHDYDAQVAKMQARGLDPAQFESYIGVHRCGLPPHGGLGIGLERLTMKLCGLSNIRDASLVPPGHQSSCALTWRPAVFTAALPPKNTAARFSGGSFLGIICFLKLYYIFSKTSLFYIKNSV